MPSSERMPGEIFQEEMLGYTNRRFKLFICCSIYASLIFTSQVLGCSQRWELWVLLTGRITLLSGFAHHFAALRTMLWFSRFQITSGGPLRVVYAALSCRWSGSWIQTSREGLLNPLAWLLKKFDMKRLRFIHTYTTRHSANLPSVWTMINVTSGILAIKQATYKRSTAKSGAFWRLYLVS